MIRAKGDARFGTCLRLSGVSPNDRRGPASTIEIARFSAEAPS
jgi:hypothetical protein